MENGQSLSYQHQPLESDDSKWCCKRCGYENEIHLRRCGRCRRLKELPRGAKPFPVELDIHPNASLRWMIEDVVGPYLHRQLRDDDIPDIELFRKMCWVLTDIEFQIFIRRYNLHRAGQHELMDIREIASQRGSHPQTTKVHLKYIQIKVGQAIIHFLKGKQS